MARDTNARGTIAILEVDVSAPETRDWIIRGHDVMPADVGRYVSGIATFADGARVRFRAPYVSRGLFTCETPAARGWRSLPWRWCVRKAAISAALNSGIRRDAIQEYRRGEKARQRAGLAAQSDEALAREARGLRLMWGSTWNLSTDCIGFRAVKLGMIRAELKRRAKARAGEVKADRRAMDWRKAAGGCGFVGTDAAGRTHARVSREAGATAWAAAVRYRDSSLCDDGFRTNGDARQWCEERAAELARAWFARMEADSFAALRDAARHAGRNYADALAQYAPDSLAHRDMMSRLRDGEAARLALLSFHAYPASEWRAEWRRAFDTSARDTMRAAMEAAREETVSGA